MFMQGQSGIDKVFSDSESLRKFMFLSNYKQFDYANNFATLICSELDIETPKIVIGTNFLYGCRFNTDTDTVELDATQIEFYATSPLIIIAHELRHKWQFANKILEPLPIGNPLRATHFMWNQEIVQCFNKEHHTRPWEIDAIFYERDTAERLGYKPFPRDEEVLQYLQIA